MLRRVVLGSRNVVFVDSKSSLSTKAGPLAGVKVLDLTRIVAGPVCTLSLADYGAEVIKIEHPAVGDDTRRWPPYMGNSDVSCHFLASNVNKKSVCVNFKMPDGQTLLKLLAQQCDVLVENYVPGVLRKYCLDYVSLRSVAPRLIYCSITGFGSEGPYAEKAGVDLIAASMSGHLSVTGPEDGEPCRAGASVVDLMTGLRAHGAILAALYERGTTNRGCKIDVDLFSSGLVALNSHAIAYLNTGIVPKRCGTEYSNVVPYKAFESKDGYIAAGAINDKQFKEFCQTLGLPELLTDARFCSNARRCEHRKELVAILAPIFKKRTTQEWCDALAGTNLPYGPLNTMKQSTTPPTLRLKCRKPRTDKSVKWNEDTVDNENMNKKKSKCCCIYKKPKQRFDESSESESDECDNCFGHVEVKKQKKIAKASCSTESTAPSSNDVSLDHAQPINPSGMAAVSS